MAVEFYYVGAATCLLNIDNCVKIGIDPALLPKDSEVNFKSFNSVRKNAPDVKEGIFDNIDLWLITHSHEDHLDRFGIDVINQDSVVICESKNTADILNRKCKVLKWNNSYTFTKGDILVEIIAVPAYHAKNFLICKSVGKVNGYILKIKSGNTERNIYFTGDTVFSKKVVNAVSKPVDVMIANLGNVKGNSLIGPLTMNLKMLDRFIKIIEPNVVVPVHIDDYSHYEMTRKQVTDAGYKIISSGKWIRILV